MCLFAVTRKFPEGKKKILQFQTYVTNQIFAPWVLPLTWRKRECSRILYGKNWMLLIDLQEVKKQDLICSNKNLPTYILADFGNKKIQFRQHNQCLESQFFWRELHFERWHLRRFLVYHYSKDFVCNVCCLSTITSSPT